MDSVPQKWRELRGGRIYVDANAWIYARDEAARWDELRDFFRRAQADEWKLVTSELSLAEALVWPIQNRDRRAQSEFQEALQNASHLVVVPVSRAVLIEAATLRATRSLEMPDAIHAATAKLARCSHFLTGDEELARAVHFARLSPDAIITS